MAGVKIGHGAVIGVASVVTKDVPPYAIAVGAPARVIGHRFGERQIHRLLKIGWWDWDDEHIERALDLFYRKDVDSALDLMEMDGGAPVQCSKQSL
jgi:acyl-[acyl carrier protein]--UDP-N-acetylglucosamine O-acyltransferase